MIIGTPDMNSILASTSYRNAIAHKKLSRADSLELLHRTIDGRHNWLERIAAFNSPPVSTTRVYLPAPYKIEASDPT